VMHGGWGPILSLQLGLAATLGGALLQTVLTWLQWAYGHRRTSWPYLAGLGTDAGLTTYGFGPLLVPIAAPILAARGIPEAQLVGWFIVGLVALLLAWYPESRLID
jgi:hypothetical protein